jgi:hypothetical protein
LKKSEIQVGHLYLATVSGKKAVLRVDAINEVCIGSIKVATRYRCTNLRSKREVTARSAARFHVEVTEEQAAYYLTP